jgi:hypothetical protein
MHRSFVRVAVAVCAIGLLGSTTRIIAEDRSADFGAFIASQLRDHSMEGRVGVREHTAGVCREARSAPGRRRSRVSVRLLHVCLGTRLASLVTWTMGIRMLAAAIPSRPR